MNTGYLFVYFTGETEKGEQIYFSISADGLHWEDLNGGEPVLYSNIGEKGVRDPFVLRSHDEKHFYMIATDLRIANGKSWAEAQREGSKSIIVWESDDLINWSKERSCEVGLPEAGCVWAPEAIYDVERRAYLVFWASRVQESDNERGKHRIYYAYTKDFINFTKAEKYIEKNNDVIDTTIVLDNGKFYRFSKDETTKHINIDFGEDLLGQFKKIDSDVLDQLIGVEGPTVCCLSDSRGWCLFVDQFAKGLGYLPLLCSNLEKGDFKIMSSEEYDMGKNIKRHGSILSINFEEYKALYKKWGDELNTNPLIAGLFADPDMIKYKDKYYLYPTTDGYSHWSGIEFYAFSSLDKKIWREEGCVLNVKSHQVPWATGSAWAPAMFVRNDTFYFYFCAKREDGVSCIGVASSNSPIDGFIAEEVPLITPELVAAEGVIMSQTIDPSIYEEDGEVYLLFGNGLPAIVKLADDLLHICSNTMKNIGGAEEFREAITVFKKESNYHFTWSCDDTGSENYHVNYGISDKLYGPIKFMYPLLQKCPQKDIYGTGHHCIYKEEGKEEYDIIYHRFATPTNDYPEEKGCHREVCRSRLEFEKGLLKPVYL